MALLALLVAALLFTTIALWLNWRQAVFQKKELERAIYEADMQTGFVAKMEPEHFVPTRHKVEFPGEIVAPYEDCRRYELLRDASLTGKLRSQRRAR